MPSYSDPDHSYRLSYREAGVDIDRGNALIERIKPLVTPTHGPEVMAGLGGFGGLYELPTGRYQQPVLVSSTDGVGTKVHLAQRMDKHDTIGIDLVAMCVNDILAQGAAPIFFQDYFATGHLSVDIASKVIEGISAGCAEAGAALIGGETAEMPGMYADGEYDLAGFCVGVAEKTRLLDKQTVQVGDRLLGLASSGIHANGYSLVNRVLEVSNSSLQQPFGSTTLGEALLAPTSIYVKPLLPLIENQALRVVAHITGGGLTENLPRVLPDHRSAALDLSSWPRPALFDWLQDQGGIETREMLRVFNCGIGLVVIIEPAQEAAVLAHCRARGIETWVIGEVIQDEGPARVHYR